MPSVLLVDDEPDLVSAWHYILTDAGYRVRSASNGVAALEMLRADRADLVITDWMMPVMNGAELCRALRAHPTLADIRVLVLTSVSSPSNPIDRVWDEWLVKPASREDFLATVARLCDLG
jgi:CheY-like chemotaxis protein